MAHNPNYWTPIRFNSPACFFHMVANKHALFTNKAADAYRCVTKDECKSLCEALNDTSDDGWIPTKLKGIH